MNNFYFYLPLERNKPDIIKASERNEPACSSVETCLCHEDSTTSPPPAEGRGCGGGEQGVLLGLSVSPDRGADNRLEKHPTLESCDAVSVVCNYEPAGVSLNSDS